jgi:hypothetical protein
MQVWNGHIRESEYVLLDPAVAVQAFWSEQHTNACLAVAAGRYIYVYMGVKIHIKITIPSEVVQSEDEGAWCARQSLLIMLLSFTAAPTSLFKLRKPCTLPCCIARIRATSFMVTQL